MSNLIAKLRKISTDELLCRAKTTAYKKCERIRHVTLGNSLTDASFLKRLEWNIITEGHLADRSANCFDETGKKLLNYMRNRQNVRFFIDGQKKTELIETIRKHFPEIIPKAIKAADAVCNHEFSFLGIDIKYDEEIPWTADPVSQKQWPEVFYDDVDIFGGDIGNGDVKHVWEVNRHQYFINLGKAYWLTGNEKYAEEFLKLIKSWIYFNPYKVGVNWASTLELAYRSISWIWTYYFCLDSKHLDEQTNLEILKSLYQHGKYMEKHLSFYHSPYNHLIGEATALFLIGAVFPEFKATKKWKEKGWKALGSEIENQFYSDGGSVEQATFYHHATLGFYLLAALLKKINGEKVSPKIWETIEKATEFSMYMISPDGKVPMIGDTDDARPIRIDNPPHWDFRAFLSIGAVLFNRGDMKKLSGVCAEDSLWLFGTEGFKRYQALEETAPLETSKAFHSSGYYIMRSNWEKNANYLCFDCGEQAAGLHKDATLSAAHGHADFLAFEVCGFGKPILIDPGFYTYNGEQEWVDYFRQTRAHNTIVVDGENQSKHHGNMIWSNVAKVHCEKWISTDAFDYVSGVHNGYTRISESLHHKRTIFFKKPEYWIVRDYLEGSGEHVVESYFHFAPMELKVDWEQKTVITKNLIIKPVEPKLNQIELINESNDFPSSGWMATSYGCKIQAPIIKYSIKEQLPLVWNMLIYPYAESATKIEVEKLELSTERCNGFKICFEEMQDYFLFSGSYGAIIQSELFESDGEVVYFRRSKSGELIQLSMINGSYFKMAGNFTFRLGKKLSFASVNFEASQPLFEFSERLEAALNLCF